MSGPHDLIHQGILVAPGWGVHALHHVLEVDHPHDIVDAFPDHGDAGMPGFDAQVERLGCEFPRFDPHHVGAGHHDFSSNAVGKIKHVLHHATVDLDFALGLGDLHHFLQLYLGGIRSVLETTTRRQNITNTNQHFRYWVEDSEGRPEEKRRHQRHRVGVLPPYGAGEHAHDHEREQGHPTDGCRERPFDARR